MNNIPKTLIVDDEHLNRILLSRSLQSFNISYDESTDGQEAIDWVKQSSEKELIILLDLNMPVMDGYEVLAYLDTNPSEFSDKKIAIIIVSAASQNSFEELCELAGITFKTSAYLEKPVSKSRLQEALLLATNNIKSVL